MSNFDATEVVVWVQKNVGGSISRMMAYPDSGMVDLNMDDSFREQMYLQSTVFLTSDIPLEMDIKKECVLQCLLLLENSAMLRAKDSELRTLSGRATFIRGLSKVEDLIKSLSKENAFTNMLAKEVEKISKSIEYINSLPLAFAEKLEKSRATAGNTPSGKAPTA